ncbi:MAG: hypothetical protein MI919_15065, partial [Holophagales bacterium]|nr:hypothetical protein [Holophagales bacterium]
MADSYEVVSEQSWGQRLGGSIKGIFSGILIGAAGVVLLFWGEGRAVKRAQLLDQGASTVVSVDAAAPSPAHEGDLVHFIGRTDAFESPEDPTFGIRTDALELLRRVEMYQWQEHSKSETEKQTGGGT